MKKSVLLKILDEEITKLASRSFEDLQGLRDQPARREGDREGQYYSVEVDLLECKKTWLQIGVCVGDNGWRSFFPVCRSFIVHSDGRVEK